MKNFRNLLTLALFVAAGAWADDITLNNPITITLDNPNQTGSVGETLHFFGTVTNTDANSGDNPTYLNSDSFTFFLTDAVQNDNFGSLPLDLAPGASSGDIDLFDYTIADPEALPLGLYAGSYELIGGDDGGSGAAADTLAQAGFSVDVVTPEPASLWMLAGVLALFGALRYAGRDSRSASQL